MAQFLTIMKKAFLDHFGKAGFVLLKGIMHPFHKKTSHPYFVRLINGDILHILSYRQLSAERVGEKTIQLLAGSVSLYRRKLNFSPEPESFFIDSIVSFLQKSCKLSSSMDFLYKVVSFQCRTESEEAMQADIDYALSMLEKYILPILDQVQNPESCVTYFRTYYPCGGYLKLDTWETFLSNERYAVSEGLLLILTEDRSDCIEEMECAIAQEIPFLRSADDIPKLREKYEKRRIEQISFRDTILDSPTLKQAALAEAERCKEINLEWLKLHGFK